MVGMVSFLAPFKGSSIVSGGSELSYSTGAVTTASRRLPPVL